jgi:transcriptional regulator with XRE-family HTH domain
MARRPHYSNPPDERGSPLTPRALTKQEFGRRLQGLLDERHWSQSDLVREVADKTGAKVGRDAISTYINGRSYPTSKSLNLLCAALGVTREELMPNAMMRAIDDEHPSLELRMAPGQPDKAWVRVNRLMTLETATEIVKLINAEAASAAEGDCG